jgi:hypothetical protein
MAARRSNGMCIGRMDGARSAGDRKSCDSINRKGGTKYADQRVGRDQDGLLLTDRRARKATTCPRRRGMGAGPVPTEWCYARAVGVRKQSTGLPKP